MAESSLRARANALDAEYLLRVRNQVNHLTERQSSSQILSNQQKLLGVAGGDRVPTEFVAICFLVRI